MRKITLTIGIPAHNEEGNIENMILSVLKQKNRYFKLEKIIIVLDGCTDNTYTIVKKLSNKYKFIRILNDKKRLGKATRLNQIYSLNKSDYIGTFDADIVLKRNCELELIIKEFIKNKQLLVVAGRQIPYPASTLMGRFSDASFMMLQRASMMWRDGNNIHSLQGSATIIESKFAKSMHIPADTTCDQGFLYISIINKNRSYFKFAKKTKILFRSPDTFLDWRKLSSRTMINDKKSMLKYFGKISLNEYSMPKKFIYEGIINELLNNPIGGIGSIIMNIYIRRFPYNTKKKSNGIWETTVSTKNLIKI